jgi:alginate O-acetyltransferase complex protein AlgI
MMNLWVCFLASGLWHGAAWTYVLWGAYNGLFLVLDRLFLLRILDALPRAVANAATLLIVIVGWTIFRAASLPQLVAFAHAMTHPALHGVAFEWENSLIAATIAGTVISLAPRVRGIDRAVAWIAAQRPGRFAIEAVGVVLFAAALDKAITDPFRPFLYFRF